MGISHLSCEGQGHSHSHSHGKTPTDILVTMGVDSWVPEVGCKLGVTRFTWAARGFRTAATRSPIINVFAPILLCSVRQDNDFKSGHFV